MKKWQKKRLSDRKAQEAYWKGHRFCEVCLAERRGKVAAVCVHEILYKSQMGKCEEDNMLSICNDCHLRAHFRKSSYLHREELYKMKGGEIDEESNLS